MIAQDQIDILGKRSVVRLGQVFYFRDDIRIQRNTHLFFQRFHNTHPDKIILLNRL